jgi:hypothetical protein
MGPPLEIGAAIQEAGRILAIDESNNAMRKPEKDTLGLEFEENMIEKKNKETFQSDKKKKFSQFPRQYSKEIDQTPAVNRHNQLEFDIDEEESNTLKEPAAKLHRVSSKDIKYQESKQFDDFPDIDISSALLFDHKISSQTQESHEQPTAPAPMSNKEAIQLLLQADLGDDDYDLIPDFEHLELTPFLTRGSSGQVKPSSISN